ncbi:MAG: ATP-binding protein [Spirochaetaceae bacterium]|jgi:hypothetical protein|nr:ATP-binding protein [Spirochaetaceae bacterium]
MILKSFEYSEIQNTEKYWVIKDFTLEKINLFTAKNATGKSRTIDAINWLSVLILDKGFKSNASYTVEFSDESENYHYFLKIEEKKVSSEKLICNNKTLLSRDESGKGKIYTAQIGDIEFQSPENKLAISRRDKIQYPYLEKIHEWANNLHFYSFGSTMNQEYGKRLEGKNASLGGDSDIPVEVFVVGNFEFDKKYKKAILSSMRKIGYKLSDIDAERWLYLDRNVRSEDYTLFITEKDIKGLILQKEISQGMFRAMSIIIHLIYYAMMKIPVTILIDDIGEGLDFERSSKLIKLLIELAEKNKNIQLIMSTNDRFVMNNVPLEYWQVIQRSGGKCRVFNCRNSKEKFDEFQYMGLNNFDFLATDYISSKWKKT